MLTIYPAIFHEEDGTFWAEFPDLEGCQTCGATLEETMTLKKTLSIPEWLNEEAEKRHINFSSVLRNALEQELAK